ncbi:MAG: single-stranded DNA-binding protein [Spirochaetaceae bacterium]|jgi:single-strand DNA-binding protein|nr:single-stranded DNA-binding protein [Spirochaetaceae bacterium]
MRDLNHVMVIGRLTRDAELKYTANGQAVCRFSIAVNRNKKIGDQWEDEANFFDIVVWGRQGQNLENIMKYLIKGKQIGIDGELRQDRWVQDGQNRSKIEIIANNFQFLGTSGNSAGGPPNPGPAGGISNPGSSYGRPERRSESYAEKGPPPREREPSGAPSSDGFADDIPF